MKNISQNINTQITSKSINFDASALKFEKNKGVCVMADGKANKGILSDKWASFLCDKTNTTPIESFNGFKLFVDTVWEDFYEQIENETKDGFVMSAFEKQGSFSTYTACWFSQNKSKIMYNWISYGNSAVLIYNSKTEELTMPMYRNSILGFLNNEGLINWKEDSLNESFFSREVEKELKPHEKIILATDVMAEHLVLSYLIIKSKDDKHWDNISKLMLSDKVLSDLIFKNRNAYAFSNFDDLLAHWEDKVNNNTIGDYITDLQANKMIAVDDISLQVIAYDKGKELLTNHKPVTIKAVPNLVIPKRKPVVKPIKPTFKSGADAYMDYLLDHRVTKLYHFTDRSNLQSIKQNGGLYSWHYLLNNNIAINRPGGDNLSRMLDSRHGLQNFVRTSFCKDHPMLYIAKKDDRIDNAVILEIDPIVVTLYDTMFSNENATKNGHLKGATFEDLERIDIGICKQPKYYNLSDEDKSYYQAEVMVLEFIPAKYILNLNSL